MNRNDVRPRGEIFSKPLDNGAQKLAESHLALARRLAWKHYRNCSRKVPLDELHGEALFGLVYAAGMFDVSRGVPFGAYATMAITHRLIHAVNIWRRGGRLDHVRFTDLCANSPDEFDTPCPRTRESIEDAILHERLDSVRRLLPPRLFRAMQLYYAHGHTMEEVGRQLGVTRERVRQLLIRAMGQARGEDDRKISTPFFSI